MSGLRCSAGMFVCENRGIRLTSKAPAGGPALPGTRLMMSIARDKFRSAVLSFLLGLMVFGFLTSVCLVLTPAIAGAQDDQPGDGEKPPVAKEKVNPFVHFFV